METENVTTAAVKTRGWTKARAVLAGGLVLGVGAAITLAAWTDNEFAKGIFASGNFGIVGSPTNSDFAEHNSVGGAATITFAVNANKLAPSDVVHGSYFVKLTNNSSNIANVTISNTGFKDGTDTVAGLQATHRLIADNADCDASVFTAGSQSDSFTLSNTNQVQQVCFQVTAGAGLEQGKAAEIVWTFAAESGGVIS